MAKPLKVENFIASVKSQLDIVVCKYIHRSRNHFVVRFDLNTGKSRSRECKTIEEAQEIYKAITGTEYNVQKVTNKDQIKLILELHEKGLSPTKIMKQTGCTIYAVKSALKDVKANNPKAESSSRQFLVKLVDLIQSHLSETRINLNIE